jgi:hypothetical protein
MTVQTTQTASASLWSPGRWPAAPTYAAAFLLIPLSLRASARRLRNPRSHLRRILTWCLFGIVVTGLLSACSGGYRLPIATTPSSSYTITVTATSGNDVQTTTVLLMVQQ